MVQQLLDVSQHLIQAQQKAEALFDELEARNLIQAGLMESEINEKIYDLAFELFGIRKYWHKRIVRAGANTLHPYRENPPDLMVQADDIVFLDFGPVFEEWEADYGRTYVLGDDPVKLKLKQDTERAFEVGRQYFLQHRETLTGQSFYEYMCQLAKQYGWAFGGPIAGHIVGQFPHERILGDEKVHYIHPDNPTRLSEPDSQGNPRHWILEIHLVDREKQIGAFVEALI